MTLTNSHSANKSDEIGTAPVLGADATETADTPVQQEADPQQQERTNIADLPEDMQNYIRELRQENARYRTERNNLNVRMDTVDTALQQVLEQVGRLPAEQQSAEDSQTEPSPVVAGKEIPSTENLSEVVLDVFQHLQLENTRMRVVAETGLEHSVVASLRGESYDDLLEQANTIKSLLPQPSGDSTPPTQQKPQTNKPPKAPSGNSTPTTSDAQRRGTYFGTGVNQSSSVFARTPGNLND